MNCRGWKASWEVRALRAVGRWLAGGRRRRRDFLERAPGGRKLLMAVAIEVEIEAEADFEEESRQMENSEQRRRP